MPELTMIEVLQQQVREKPDKLFMRFRNEDYTYREFDHQSSRLASGLMQLGISQSDVLPTLLPNCGDAILLWFALSRLGAVWAPLNTEFRGEGLAHAINLTGADTLVVDIQFLEAVREISDKLTRLNRLIVRGDEKKRALPEMTILSLGDLPSDISLPGITLNESDTCMLIYTSGTTGVSKACELSHRYVVGQAELLCRVLGAHADDIMLCPFPIFHWDATVGTVIAALLAGATGVLTERFSVSRFWKDIRHFGATIFDFMGATLALLFKQEPRSDDADNPARLAWGVPMPDFAKSFERRFGVKLVEGYGSTEAGVCVYQRPDENYPDGSCGRVTPEYELRILDDTDQEVPIGQISEIVVRPRDRLLMMTGYHGMPDITAEVIRDGWFHSGDLGRMDAEGNLFFEGRKKDAIRRRGENISCFEIEQVIESHPAVLEAAAYGVSSELTEEDVAVAVVLREGVELSAEQLVDFCQGRMARYMVPLYVSFHSTLPKTPTEKVAKHKLQQWHRENCPAPTTLE